VGVQACGRHSKGAGSPSWGVGGACPPAGLAPSQEGHLQESKHESGVTEPPVGRTATRAAGSCAGARSFPGLKPVQSLNVCLQDDGMLLAACARLPVFSDKCLAWHELQCLINQGNAAPSFSNRWQFELTTVHFEDGLLKSKANALVILHFDA
jgi:hypothetical protein